MCRPTVKVVAVACAAVRARLCGHEAEDRDCSGFVDMAWHLDNDPNTDSLATSLYTFAISRSELKPGDLLDDVGTHAILFGGWEDSAKTKFWYYSFGRYLDQNPYDLNGSDLTGLGAVDASGWSQVRLSAQPRTVS